MVAENPVVKCHDNLDKMPKELKNRNFVKMMNKKEPEEVKNILKELVIEDNKKFGANIYQKRKNEVGRRRMIEDAKEFNDRREEILHIFKEEYIKFSIEEQAPMPSPCPFDVMVEHCKRKEEIRRRCVYEWQNYCKDE